MGVSPFGNPRIDACLRLPEAYRSLPRPSSAPIAKAFALRPFVLNLRFYARIFFTLVNCFTTISTNLFLLPELSLSFPQISFFLLLCSSLAFNFLSEN